MTVMHAAHNVDVAFVQCAPPQSSSLVTLPAAEDVLGLGPLSCTYTLHYPPRFQAPGMLLMNPCTLFCALPKLATPDVPSALQLLQLVREAHP